MHRRVFFLSALLAATVPLAGLAETGGSPTATPPPAIDATACAVGPEVIALDRARRRYAVKLRGFETGTATGTVSLFAGDVRYDIPVHDAVYQGYLDRATVPTPIVVRFPDDVTIDGAVVTSLSKHTGTCAPAFSPWHTRAHNPNEFDSRTPPEVQRDERFLADARSAAAIDAPNPIADRRPCSDPDHPPATITAAQPVMPFMLQQLQIEATIDVLVVLRPDDTIAETAVLHGSENAQIDQVARRAASESTFRGETFRCNHVIGLYRFLVAFMRG